MQTLANSPVLAPKYSLAVDSTEDVVLARVQSKVKWNRFLQKLQISSI